MDLSLILRDGHIEECEGGEQEGREEGLSQVSYTGSELSMVPKTGVRGGDDG